MTIISIELIHDFSLQRKSQFIVLWQRVYQALGLLAEIRLFWVNKTFESWLIYMIFAKPLKRQRIYVAVCEIILFRESNEI
jgi:hypothetical protein